MPRYLLLCSLAASVFWKLSSSHDCEDDYFIMPKMNVRKSMLYRVPVPKVPIIPRVYTELKTTCEVRNDQLHTSGVVIGNFTNIAWLHVTVVNSESEDWTFVISTDSQHHPIIMDHNKYMHGTSLVSLAAKATFYNRLGITKNVRVEDKRVFNYNFKLPVRSNVQRVTMHIEPETEPFFIRCEPTYGLNYNPKIWMHWFFEMFCTFGKNRLKDSVFIVTAWVLTYVAWLLCIQAYRSMSMDYMAYRKTQMAMYQSRSRHTDHKDTDTTYDIGVAKTSTNTETQPQRRLNCRNDIGQAFS
ncbi:membrane glycoprotein US6A [Cercopithecine betaherpesvirus 5]|uniref:Membrane glycoprotein US6A n=1 Tax=Simian cytomegalovirus (strain Colburn) TaxID=50292 RepID=G8XTL3_SCMVC|nr:membrane glycoprotein US6A [Cercopithecine betaherpesvirus 5]AEV80505.1 membrane glycoprotein US6A [Cercopithecine betaherpesvirus 5]